LEEVRFAVLGTTNADGSPQQTVMWYRLEGDTIVMNTKRGRMKDRNLSRDPRASLCVADGRRYVTVNGTITIDPDPDRGQREIHALGVRYDGKASADHEARTVWSTQHRITLELSIDRIDVHGLE
jgi:PPOX class probable F420-dependent enzyme